MQNGSAHNFSFHFGFIHSVDTQWVHTKNVFASDKMS